ncbi:MAG: hypothetical protein JST08_11610 [Actinobacteria bacterium]|nr:hypothetical protein [Actinomycetota bacterium]
MSEADQVHRQMAEWADRFGSGRLRLALEKGDSPRRLYLEERLQVELPGFALAMDDWESMAPSPDPDEKAISAREAIGGYLDASGIRYTACEIVRSDTEFAEQSAIRVRGWEGEAAVIAFPTRPDGSDVSGDDYPVGVAGRTDSRLRPTAYGSAYGLRHPAAQEALRIAAIVSVDQLGDLGREELMEYLPPDAHDLIDDALVHDMVDTLYLVGWKFGQPRRLLLANLAEQIAGFILIRQAEGILEDKEMLSTAGMEQARLELDDLEQVVLDEEFLYEYLPSVDAQTLAEIVPSGLTSRRTALWAPWYAEGGEPSPRATGDDEPRWSLSEPPGMTARESVAVRSREREEEKEAELEALAGELAQLPWTLEFNHRDAYLLALRPDGYLASFCPPPAIHGAARVSPWAWVYGRYSSRDAAFGHTEEPQDDQILDWPEFFRVFPGRSHPLAIDAIFSVIEVALGWTRAVGGHALAAGAVTPFEQCAEALEGIVAMREQLERCRAAGLVRDERLTRFGVRHELFGSPDLRFVAEARFAPSPGQTFDEVQGKFNQAIYDFSPLPISLGIEPHEEGDGSLLVRCAMGVPSIEEADVLANEVISQILWRVGLQPIDLDEGEEIDDVGFKIVDLEHGEEESPGG